MERLYIETGRTGIPIINHMSPQCSKTNPNATANVVIYIPLLD